MNDEANVVGVGRLLRGAMVIALKIAAWAFVIAVPLLGVWAGSSLAVYWDGPLWAAIVAGLGAFPILPLAWESFSAWRRSKKDKPPPRVLTFSDRLVIRTFVLNFVFLALFLAFWPMPIFEALASRGDWMLHERHDPTSESIRRALLGTADKMNWLYEAAHENEYEDEDEEPLPTPAPTPTRRTASPVPPPAPAVAHEEAHARAARLRGNGPPSWPLPEELHPIVRAIPPEHEQSIESVARYIASQERDPYLRVKALHDYVADRVAYDVEALAMAPTERPSQEAEAIFSSRRGVCAGYAHLFEALGRAAGENVVYVVGNAREDEDAASGGGHAWNAVEIEGRWYLVDVTWDAGALDDGRFEKRYKSDYFLAPPDVFSLDHFPDRPEWQLRETPLTRGEFVRQPRLKPAFFLAGWRLRSPDRSHVTVDDDFVARIANPYGHSALARIRPHGSNRDGERCNVANGPEILVRCRTPEGGGLWDVVVYQSPQQYATYWDVASFQVTRN